MLIFLPPYLSHEKLSHQLCFLAKQTSIYQAPSCLFMNDVSAFVPLRVNQGIKNTLAHSETMLDLCPQKKMLTSAKLIAENSLLDYIRRRKLVENCRLQGLFSSVVASVCYTCSTPPTGGQKQLKPSSHLDSTETRVFAIRCWFHTQSFAVQSSA